MYSLMIVDDEPTVRKGMISCIDWKKYGIEIISEADNGAIALKKAVDVHPHIVLTDIRMPVMDGIELSYHLRKQLPDCKIVIMSGYDEFAYAKSLMRMKVTEYLLKPIAEEELLLVIERLLTEIKEDEANKSSQQAADRLLHENLPQLRLNFMRKILDGSLSEIEEATEQAAVLYLTIPMQGGLFHAVIIAMDGAGATQNQHTEYESKALTEEIISIADELINQAASGFLCGNGSGNFIGLICRGREYEYDPDLINKNIRREIKERLNVTVFLSIGPAVESIASINVSYEKALSELDEKRYKGKRNFVQIALRYVEEHYDTDIGLVDVSGIAFVTPNYFSKVFKEEMGMSFIDYLNQLRINKAKELLLNTNLKTYEIAEKVGYKDYKYFSAMLKKLTGSSPREYRRNT